MVGQDSCVEVVLGAMRLECEDICASLMWTSFPMAFKHWSMEPSLSAAASDTSSHRGTSREQRRLFTGAPTTKSPLSMEPLVYW